MIYWIIGACVVIYLVYGFAKDLAEAIMYPYYKELDEQMRRLEQLKKKINK